MIFIHYLSGKINYLIHINEKTQHCIYKSQIQPIDTVLLYGTSAKILASLPKWSLPSTQHTVGKGYPTL